MSEEQKKDKKEWNISSDALEKINLRLWSLRTIIAEKCLFIRDKDKEDSTPPQP